MSTSVESSAALHCQVSQAMIVLSLHSAAVAGTAARLAMVTARLTMVCDGHLTACCWIVRRRDPSLESVESTRKVRLTTSGRSEPDAMHIKHGVRSLTFCAVALPLLSTRPAEKVHRTCTLSIAAGFDDDPIQWRALHRETFMHPLSRPPNHTMTI